MKSFSQSGLCSPSAAAAVHAVRLEVIYFAWWCPHLSPSPSLQPNPPLSNFPNKFKLNLEIKCAAKTNCMFGNNSGGFLKSSTKATHDWSSIRCRSRSATSWLVSLFFFSLGKSGRQSGCNGSSSSCQLCIHTLETGLSKESWQHS